MARRIHGSVSLHQTVKSWAVQYSGVRDTRSCRYRLPERLVCEAMAPTGFPD